MRDRKTNVTTLTQTQMKAILMEAGFMEDVVVALDEAGSWVHDPITGHTYRPDGKFFEVDWADRGGYGHPVLRQEPSVTPDESDRRIVGHVIVEYQRVGTFFITVRYRKAQGLNGEILELKPSSISKGELAEAGVVPTGYFNADPQRIDGLIAVYAVETTYPDEEAMVVEDFVTRSKDGRSLAAIAVAGL